jgi:hypothetical protein
MMFTRNQWRAATVLAAGAVVVLLSGSLALRAADRPEAEVRRPVAAPKGPAAPAPATVPEPRPLTLEDIPTPECWICPGGHFRSADFTLDLDTLAPLGDGRSNAALWFRRFARHDGDRAQENYRADRRYIEMAGAGYQVLSPDSPILTEAEPWLNQASCSFYPEIWELGGSDTPIPNLLLVMDLARGYVARGLAEEDPTIAREDFRRAIRLGRLVLQDDATIIQDLIGAECVRIGAWAIQQQARAEGDTLLVAATNTVLADHGGRKARTSVEVRKASRVYESVRRGFFGGLSLDMAEGDVHAVLLLAQRSPERRYRLEALVALRVVYQLGDDEQRGWIEEGLKEMVESDDLHLAKLARLALDEPLTEAQEAQLSDMVHDE